MRTGRPTRHRLPRPYDKARRQFGGFSGLARALDVSLTTVHGWAIRGSVPSWRAQQIEALMRGGPPLDAGAILDRVIVDSEQLGLKHGERLIFLAGVEYGMELMGAPDATPVR